MTVEFFDRNCPKIFCCYLSVAYFFQSLDGFSWRRLSSFLEWWAMWFAGLVWPMEETYNPWSYHADRCGGPCLLGEIVDVLMSAFHESGWSVAVILVVALFLLRWHCGMKVLIFWGSTSMSMCPSSVKLKTFLFWAVLVSCTTITVWRFTIEKCISACKHLFMNEVQESVQKKTIETVTLKTTYTKRNHKF